MRLILFGDSLTFGYGVWKKDNIESLIKKAHPNWEVINKGINGDTTREALERFEEDVLNLKPDVVTFLFGSNDSAMGDGPYRTLYEYNLNLEIMTEQLKLTNPLCKVIYITPPPVDDTVFMPWTYNERLEPYVENCLKLSLKYGNALCDFNKHLKDAAGHNISDYLQEDGCHLSEKGYSELFNCLENTFKKLNLGD